MASPFDNHILISTSNREKNSHCFLRLGQIQQILTLDIPLKVKHGPGLGQAWAKHQARPNPNFHLYWANNSFSGFLVAQILHVRILQTYLMLLWFLFNFHGNYSDF